MGKKILVIDDAVAIRQMVSMILKQDGYETVEATDGSDALKKLEADQFDLAICDVNMPVMNGMEFLRALKNDAAYSAHKFLPVIMLTTEIGSDIAAKGKAEGAKAWMIKPFQPADLLDSVKKLLS
jgi:two-component system, chemotaxis family, chemotaxis protein CheY